MSELTDEEVANFPPELKAAIRAYFASHFLGGGHRRAAAAQLDGFVDGWKARDNAPMNFPLDKTLSRSI